jgi:transmembrane protein
MSGLDPPQPSGKWPTLWATLIEGLCVAACAHYPTAVLMELMADMQVRRWKPDCGEAGRRWNADALPCRKPYWKADVHKSMQHLLRKSFMEWIARALLTLPFWLSGLSKLLVFDRGVAEMARAGLHPAVVFSIATIVVQLIGSAAIIVGYGVWLGAGALGVTVLLVHRFWAITDEPFRTIALHVSVEHVA